MKCVTSLWLLCAVASVAWAIRVPSSWEEEQNYKTYKTKQRKTRQKPVLERRVGGFTQSNHRDSTKKFNRSKGENAIPVIQSRVGLENVPIFVPLDRTTESQPYYQPTYQNPESQNDWVPVIINEQQRIPVENDRSSFQYNGAVRNTVINEENPMYQRWQETKGAPTKIKRKKDRHKKLNVLAEADLIRQLEKHKLIQQNLASLDKSPGRLRSIYLEDQLNRKAINLNNQPYSLGTAIDASAVSFTTIEPEVFRSTKKKLKPTRRRKPKIISKAEAASENETEKRQKILFTNHRDDELHEPHKDNSERDDTLHEPNQDTDNEKLDNEQKEVSDNKNEENDEIEKEPDIISVKDSEEENEEVDEEGAASEEENEKRSEESVNSEHADLKNIVTKPIYPGEGQWAIPGKRHRPHISPHRFMALDSYQEKKPDGYDVFEDLSKYFDSQRASFERQGRFSSDDVVPTTRLPRFEQQLQAELPTPPPNTWRPNVPNQVQPIVVYDPFNEPSIHMTTTIKSSSQPTNHKAYQAQQKKEEGKTLVATKEGHKESLKNPKPSNNEEQENKQDEPETEKEDTESDESNEDTEEEDRSLEIDPESISEEVENDEEESDDDDEFTPMQLYTQVRHSANVNHLPPDPEESGRLKEVIRDSKVQTVYTEEGYEDLAYDHAGHEKKAESDEGFAEFEKDREEKGRREKILKAKLGHKKKSTDSEPHNTALKDNIEHDDSSLEQSINKPFKKQNNNNFMSTKKIRTTELKDKGDGNLQMEIQDKIRTVMQPNNSVTAHSSVKIYPKIYKNLNDIESETKRNLLETTTTSETFESETTTEADNNENDNNSQLTQQKPVTETTTIFTTTSPYSLGNTETPYFAADLKSGSTLKKKITEKVNSLFNIQDQQTIESKKDDNAFTEAPVTEDGFTDGYFNPEIDNFKIEDISVKSVADIFSKMQSKGETDPNLSKNIEKEASPLDRIDLQFDKSFYTLKRQKRGSGFLNVDVDTDFISQIDHSLPTKEPNYDETKYPYYKDSSIAENSPLHYAETLKNIPRKVKGKLSFYEKAEEMPCPELDEPNSIPEHIQNKANNEYDYYDDDEGTQKPGAVKKPRIELGNKIKCYKKRYFGDNPLDSPFFKEEFVGPVKPIFKELLQKTDSLSKDSEVRGSMVIKTVDNANNIFNKLDKDIKKKYLDALENKNSSNQIEYSQNKNEVVNKPTVAESVKSILTSPAPIYISATLETHTKESATTSTIKPEALPTENPNKFVPSLITTPRYTLNLTPKSIYDQITLLDYLATSGTEYASPFIPEMENMPIKANRRESKSLKEENEDDASIVEPQPLRRKIRPYKTRPNYNVIKRRVSTTTPFPIIDTKPTTVLPKYKVISEVFYKDEIQPNEQLAVFSDILNNIRNASKMEEEIKIQSTSNFSEPSAVTVSSNSASRNRFNRKKLPTRIKKYQESSFIRNKDFLSSTVSTSRPLSLNNIKLLKNPTQQQTSQIRPHKLGQISQKQKVASTSSIDIKQPVEKPNTPLRKNFQSLNFIEEAEEIIGLVPPSENYNTIVLDNQIDKKDSMASSSLDLPPEHLFEYKTILPSSTEQMPAPVNKILEEPIVIQLNKYLFLGLKPPKPQKVMPYADFLLEHSVPKISNLLKNRRFKRDSQKPAYSELSRNRGRQEEILEKPDVSEDDVDDYVPHRPKNYYYDERTGKIVYLNKPKEQSQEEEEEIVEYEEITEPRAPAVSTSPKTETRLLLVTAKPPLPGKSFIDFLAKVKSDPSYKFIPDPTTTEKGSIPETTEATTARPTVSTNPPEFLSILAKVKSDSTYKQINDPNDKKITKTSTTTEAYLEEEEVTEEEDDDRIQNVENKSGIFNIAEYLPEVREYTPRTKIDYSKYKTINRGSSRPRPSQANAAEKIDYTAIVRARKPVYDDDETTTIRLRDEQRTKLPSVTESDRSESKYDDLPVWYDSTTTVYRPTTNRRRPSKITTISTTPVLDTSEKSLEILAPPIQSRRGTRPTTTQSPTTPALVTQEPITRLPTKRRRTTTPRGFQPSVELVRTTEAVVRVYPEYTRAKRVYRRQPVHIRTKSSARSLKDLEVDEDTKVLRRRSENLSDVGQITLLDPIYVEDGPEETIDREDRSIETGNAKNQNNLKIHSKNVEVLKEYDKSKKHGGNYRKETEKEEIENHDQVGSVQKEQIEIIKKFNETVKTGGNYKPEDEAVEREILNNEDRDIDPEYQEDELPTVQKNKRLILSSNTPAQKVLHNEPLHRLTDVVPKPDHFYTDPGLPKQVNQLKDKNDHPLVNSDELEEIVTEGDHLFSSEEEGVYPVVKDELIQDRIDNEKESLIRYAEVDKAVPTQKPLFIKDPDKRLYYYAAV